MAFLQRWRYQIVFFSLTLGLLISFQTAIPETILAIFATRQQAQIWTSAVRENSLSVLLALLIAFYIEVTQTRMSRIEQAQLKTEIEDNLGKFRALMAREPHERAEVHELSRMALERQLGHSSRDVEDLSYNLFGGLSDRTLPAPVSDFSLDLVFRDTGDEDYFLVYCTQRMRWPSSQMYVALVGNDEAARDWFQRSTNRLVEVSFVAGSSFESTINDFRNTYRVTCYPKQGRSVTVSPTELGRAEKAKLFDADVPANIFSLPVMRFDLPVSNDAITVEQVLRVAHVFPAFYWNWRTPTFVSDIRYDLRDFVTAKRIQGCNFTPFMPGSVGVRSAPDLRSHTVSVKHWVLPGHGIVFLWAIGDGDIEAEGDLLSSDSSPRDVNQI